MRNYLTNCEMGLERNADYKRGREVMELFEAIPRVDDLGCGNVSGHLVVNIKTKRARFVPDYCDACGPYENPKAVGFWQAIPSALLMYRLACLFPGQIETEGHEGYKVTWTMTLRHKATGEILGFGEWKGGALFWTKYGSYKELPTQFRSDLLKLINLLISDVSPHPYDGVVAGSVA